MNVSDVLVATANVATSSHEKSRSAAMFAFQQELADGTIMKVQYGIENYMFLSFLMVTILLNLMVLVPLTIVFWRRRFKERRAILKKEAIAMMESQMDDLSVTVIVPCYLPNEQEIIEDTIKHILENVKSPGPLELSLVYNTPYDLPEVEARLQQLAACRDLYHGRTLTVTRDYHSGSKAENLNSALQNITTKYTAIYDADHRPDENSLMLLFEKMLRKNLHCVQGSTYIRNLNDGFVGRIIDAEFFVMHFMYFPAMKLLTQTGLFGGSNALWMTDVLAGREFDHRMQTEDIDMSIRSNLDERRIDFCPESRSGELAPASLRALYGQRLRWAVGWDQVAVMHWKGLAENSLSLIRKLSICHILYGRWLSSLTGIFAGVITPMLGLIWHLDPFVWGSSIFLAQKALVVLYVGIALQCVLEAVCQTHHRGWQSWIQAFLVVVFMGCGSLYVCFQTVLTGISLWRIATGTVGLWVVTKRSGTQRDIHATPVASLRGPEITPEPESPKSAIENTFTRANSIEITPLCPFLGIECRHPHKTSMDEKVAMTTLEEPEGLLTRSLGHLRNMITAGRGPWTSRSPPRSCSREFERSGPVRGSSVRYSELRCFSGHQASGPAVDGALEDDTGDLVGKCV